MNESARIAVVGAGAIGCYFGGRLMGAGHSVHFIARGTTLDALKTSGIEILSGKGDLQLPSIAVTDRPEEIGTVDLILVSVKAWQVPEVARSIAPHGLSPGRIRDLWSRIECPTLLVRGSESWAGDPNLDGRLESFHTAEAVNIDAAGHWVHHDQLDAFLGLVREFLA